LAHVLGKDRAWLIAHDDVELTPEQRRELESLIERRAQGEPIAYIIGTAWFHGRPFEVNPWVLVPRPETEHLIDEALHHLRSYAKPVVLDVGTGCGAIACTIAAELPNALVYATERSPAALEVAQRNARSRCHFELADLLPSDADVRFDCVVANLPYVPTADLPRAPDAASFEPREALDGGVDGLREYRRLLELLPKRMNPGALFLLEAAPPTIASLRALATEAFPGASVTVGSDYAHLERYIRGQTPARAER
jgi:release factor glutamine methyltransferase